MNLGGCFLVGGCVLVHSYSCVGRALLLSFVGYVLLTVMVSCGCTYGFHVDVHTKPVSLKLHFS